MTHALGRYVNHDPRSRAYAFDTSGITVQSVKHNRMVPVFEQTIGSCTGEAAVGALGTDPFYQTLANRDLSQGAAIYLYSEATKIDTIPGTYPPSDTGSDGLSVAKASQNQGYISGYTHTFTFDDALKALSVVPVLLGINWYRSFDIPNAAGVISIDAGDYVVGGHEIVADEIDLDSGIIGCTNSWGTEWGYAGRFFIKFDLFKRLLAEDGDIVAFVPINQPAPNPTPDPTPAPPGPTDADRQLWRETEYWANARHTGSNKRAATSVRKWSKNKDLS